jgi:predicted MFS family arabinose efflux permease
VFHLAPPELAWRIMFWLGVLPVLPLLWLRTRVPESPAFEAARRAQATGAGPAARPRLSFLRLFQPDLLVITLAATLLSIGARGGGTDFWIPSYLQDVRRLAPEAISVFMGMMVVGGLLGGAAGGYTVDKLGRRRGMALFAVGSALSVWAYTAVPQGDDAVLLLFGLPYAFFSTGVYGCLGAFLSELFPTDARGAGQGFAYNVGQAGSAIGPLAMGLLSSTIGLGGALDVGGATYVLCLIALLFLPETLGKNLGENAAAAPA